MHRKIKNSVTAALCCAVLGAGVAGCDGDALDHWDPRAPASAAPSPISGTRKIDVGGRSVNVSCSGEQAKGKPVIVLMAGAGDGLDKMAALQKTLAGGNRVCSYDRLGEGASDRPDGPQDLASTGKILTGVLDRVAGD
ncbi:MAG: alpha/beta hydrolase, partial [Nonomuraea sp.]|nr:alpha/beta hydrolase [Nonomuraea sp.]